MQIQKHEKRFEIQQRSRGAPMKLDLDDGKSVQMSKHGSIIKDPSVAAAIDDRYGRKGSDDVLVIPVDNWQSDPTGTHNYTFGLNGLPDGWHDRIDWGHS